MGRSHAVLLILVLGLLISFSSSSLLLAEEEGREKEIRQHINKLEKKARKAWEKGNLDEYREIKREIEELREKARHLAGENGDGQKRKEMEKALHDLYAKLDRAQSRGDKRMVAHLKEAIKDLSGRLHVGKDDWLEELEAKLRLLPPEKRMEALKRLESHLRESGQNDRAQAVRKMLKGHGKEKQKDKWLVRKEEELKKLHQQRERAAEKLDVDRVEELNGQIKRLEGAIKDHHREIERDRGGRDPVSIQELFRRLAEAKRRGDEKAMVEIREQIHNLRRGGDREGRRREGPFAPEALESMERILHRLEKKAVEADKQDKEDWVKEIKKMHRGFSDLAKKIRGCQNPEQAGKLARHIEELMTKGRRSLDELEREGDHGTVKAFGWVLDELKKVQTGLVHRIRKGGGEPDERHAAVEKLLKMAEDLDRKGRHEDAHAMREKAEGLERVLRERREGSERRGQPGREGSERMRRMREMDRERAELHQALGEAEERGDREKASKIRERLKEMEERSRRPGRGGRGRDGRNGERGRDGGDGKWGRDGRDGERGRDGDRRRDFEEQPEKTRHLDKLHEALRDAEEEGDHKKAQSLRRKIAHLKKRGDKDGRERTERDERRDREGPDARELKNDIDRLRKELRELKKLLKELLKEKDKD